MTVEHVPIELNQVLYHSQHAARMAGGILMENFGKLKDEKIRSKTAFDFVTEIDENSEKAIIQYLQQFYPDHAIHAEESGKNKKDSDFQWFIDPLDGTKNYIHSFPIFSVSIGLGYRGEIVSGVIYVPVQEEMFTSVIGQGAYLNEEPIHVSTTDDMSDIMLATGFPHGAKEYLDVYQSCFREIFLQVSAVRRAGSAAIDMAYTACGKFDGFWEFKLNPWDIGAGILMIREAGGKITDPLDGDNFFQTGDLVAGNTVLHEKLIQILRPLCKGKLGWS